MSHFLLLFYSFIDISIFNFFFTPALNSFLA